ncbi:hypothetical protein SAMN05216262_1274 [Colwellia chukchiensis]|uniref:Uncharacterized protein n=1 Tax=Colwellia chukchiensis TaxID=641665 RepID=A0A1H7TM31_9GAMM|nr:hypothetical protein SAMN05216262_1274 [Colwellia chukchiensis]
MSKCQKLDFEIKKADNKSYRPESYEESSKIQIITTRVRFRNKAIIEQQL